MHRAADASSLERARDLQTQLGKGSQGVVWKAKRKADGVLVAIKQIMLGSIFRREQADAAQVWMVWEDVLTQVRRAFNIL